MEKVSPPESTQNFSLAHDIIYFCLFIHFIHIHSIRIKGTMLKPFRDLRRVTFGKLKLDLLI